jgi:chorismate dehydratase
VGRIIGAKSLGGSSKIRLGYVEYLNSRPLVWGLESDERLALESGPPSRLAAALVAGELDCALVPVVALAGRDDLDYVAGICIGADGPVGSVHLHWRDDRPRPWKVCLDRHSRTSQMLTRIHLEEFEKRSPSDLDYYDGDPKQAAELPDITGCLIIGDLALRRPSLPGFRVVDLAQSWKTNTGTPFVFAVWAARRGVLEKNPFLAPRLAAALDAGLAVLPDIAERFAPLHGVGFATAYAYLRDSICYRLTARHEEGMAAFLQRAARMMK